MSAVLRFPDRHERAELREHKAATEAARLANLHGYGLRAVQQFQRAAARMTRECPQLSPSACAARAVPHKSTRWGDLPPGAA